jgi:hypothetical protein
VTADEHLDKAFASLDEVPIRELEATDAAISNRRHPLHAFWGIFDGVAGARQGGWDSSARFHLGEAVNRADDDLLERIAGAEAPFWVHVRDAVLAYREENA